MILRVLLHISCDKILLLPPNWLEVRAGGGAIRVHILSVKSRKDGGNDEKRQDNSKNMERVSTQEADS